MSRTYDAKQASLKAYPENREEGIRLFLGYLDCSQEDFAFENGGYPEEYIYGDETEITKKMLEE